MKEWIKDIIETAKIGLLTSIWVLLILIFNKL